ncbi:MAG: SPOR domain-containing protein [Muribaculaceae bacterium]|nr:SPOR domain-containing protein [Muribaculaceae bacterium]
MKIRLFIVSAIALVLFAACKTNEANYRAAYEIAKQKSMDGVDAETYEKMQRESMPTKEVAGGDTLRMMRASVNVAKYEGNDDVLLKRYNVVVAQFKQIFNAKAMMRRLKNQGYDAIVLQNPEPLYYVVAGSLDNKGEAVELIKKLTNDESIVLREPYPCILEPLHLVK